MNEKKNKIEINPKIMSGKPIIKGTRVPIYVILGALAAGMNYKEIAEEYGIKLDDILSCLKYAADTINSEEIYPLKRL